MNVQQVIDELSKLPPHLPVRCLMEIIESEDESGPWRVIPNDADALEATLVEWRGHDVLIFAGGMAAGGN